MAPSSSPPTHPYLAGNFRPVTQETSLTRCEVIAPQRALPAELAGGQFIRNGGNPAHIPEQGRAYHWFDGDGMLHGVYFERQPGSNALVPYFVNRYVLTDVYLAGQRRGGSMLPSISTLISPSTSLPSLLTTLIRAVALNLLSSISRLTVANTAVVFHDRRLLATCESGPCVEVRAPSLETVGYWTFEDGHGRGLGKAPLTVGKGEVGGKVMGGMLEEWTTGHPKVDPITGDLVFIGYNIFARPFLTHSVVAKDGSHVSIKQPICLAAPKMMHDFGCSLSHTIILDLPLTMDPLNLIRPLSGSKMLPTVHFDRRLKSRFGVVPRDFGGEQGRIKWFESEPCMIFHTVNSWDETLASANDRLADLGRTPAPSADEPDEVVAVNMLACRFLSAKLVHAAGGMQAPAVEERIAQETSDVVRLTYFRFSLSTSDPLASSACTTTPAFEFCLSSIPFEFSLVTHSRSMQRARYVYGVSLAWGTFDSALEGARPDVIVKMDVEELIKRGIANTDARGRRNDVDQRSVRDILDLQEERRRAGKDDEAKADPIKLFRLPPHHFASEPSFVPRDNAASEDAGFLLLYVFDEAQLPSDGSLPAEGGPSDPTSELWILDAERIGLGGEVVNRIRLPRRVPYGLHSEWVTEQQILSQRDGIPVRRREPMRDDAGSVEEAVERTVEVVEEAERAAEQGKTLWTSQQTGAALWAWSAVWALFARVFAVSALKADSTGRRGWQRKGRSGTTA